MGNWLKGAVGVALLGGLLGCGTETTSPDSGPAPADAGPDTVVADAAAADAMVDLVAACSTAYECAIDCPRCRDDCGLEHGETVNGRYQGLIMCGQNAPGGACDIQSSVHVGCLAENCADEALACLGQLPTGGGSAGCAEVYGCVVACEGNVTCTFDCYDQGSAMALRIFDRIQDCAALAVCRLADIDCVARPCGNLTSACGIMR
jgi:hypothetical protein